MVNYKNSVIYKLCSKDINIKTIYVGSTANMLRLRKSNHKSSCNNAKGKDYNLYVYQFIRENGGWNNWDIIEIERYSCSDKQELHKRERFYVETLEAKLNSHIPTRTDKEWKEENKEKLLDYQKKYYEENKEKILDYQKEYCEENKEKIAEHQKQYYEENKEKIIEHQKKYNAENKEHKKDYDKKYREENKEQIKQNYENSKEKIAEQRKEKITCECGSKITKVNLNRHCKTKKHIKCLEQQEKL